MLHEAWGIDDVLRRHADRLAAAGYLVYAPDLLGEGLWLRCISSTFRAFQARAGKPFELIESCRKALRADPECQLVMSLRRKYQKANQMAMIA